MPSPPRVLGAPLLYSRRTVIVAGLVGFAGGSFLAREIGIGPFASGSVTPYTWRYPQVNGGMGNVAQAHPSQADRLKLGGDLWGWYQSRDAAASWAGTMMGLAGIGQIYARGCRWSLQDPDACYIAVGTLKSPGGYFGIAKGIATTRRSGPQFGANLGAGAGSGLPRPVGNLIDVTLAGGVERIYAAAYNGIQTSTDAGKTWHTLYAHTGNWKAIAAVDDQTILAALYNTSGLTLVHGSVITHPAAPGVIHDLRNIAGTVWAVGPGGVYRWNGTALAKHPTTFFATHKPTSIDGSADGQVILVGVDDPNSAALSTDGGASWHWLKSGNTGKLLDGRAYWLNTLATNGWGQQRFSASQVCVDKVNPHHLYVAGRGGGWASHDQGASWYAAAPSGDEVSSARGGPGQDEFAANSGDWTGWHTPDAFLHTDHVKQSQSGLHTGLTYTSGGHTYKVSPGHITKDGSDIADDVFRGACVDPKTIAVSPSGKLLVVQLGGTSILGTP